MICDDCKYADIRCVDSRWKFLCMKTREIQYEYKDTCTDYDMEGEE